MKQGAKMKKPSSRGQQTKEREQPAGHGGESRIIRDAEDVERRYYEASDVPMEVPTERVRQVLTEGVRHEEAGERQHRERLRTHTSESPELSGGDVDAAWDRADVGEETVSGSNPTPDQDVVDEIGAAVGLTYEEDEPLAIDDKLAARDEARWELDPASSEDYQERVRQRPEDEP